MRICDNCGEDKEEYGGKTCSNGHFICEDCVRNLRNDNEFQDAYEFIIDIIEGGAAGPFCPICKTRLR